jgi:hypothetical protein
MELVEGSSAEMVVTVTGTKHIHVTWFRDNIQLVHDDRHSFTVDGDTHTMRISPVTLDDEAMYYKVVAENVAGQAVCDAEVIVEGG